ncbi:MAG: sigma-54-dependent Fis family transcriptional regulator [Acidobacteria bacterium]|nr:sigma-54-dependent Fis family transcriptional regulator [Acidobacteriota bacterium]
MADILVVEDKDSLREMLCMTLERAGYSVAEAGDAARARRALQDQLPQLVLTDLRMPHGGGLEVLRITKTLDPDLPVIILTAYGSIDEAVQAMKDGALDFLQKPVDSEHLLLVVGRAIEAQRLQREAILLREEYSKRYGFPRIVGDSLVMQQVSKQIQQVATTSTTVLLLGESGTGKELFARAVHHLSPRANRPFIALNCAAIPETLIENELFGHERGAYTGADSRRAGKFELAQGGTIFLDEIGELPLAVQSKLLRVIEERTITRIGGSAEIAVDVRIVTATNRDLNQAVADKTFREDLFFRLSIFPVRIPSLRERRSDIPQLAESFAQHYGREIRRSTIKISDEAMRSMVAYDWPGNVRELKSCIERACILCNGKVIEARDCSLFTPSQQKSRTDRFLEGIDFGGTLSEVTDRVTRMVEKRKIELTLEETSFNKTRTAELLGISLKTLASRMKDLAIE